MFLLLFHTNKCRLYIAYNYIHIVHVQDKWWDISMAPTVLTEICYLKSGTKEHGRIVYNETQFINNLW